MCVCVCVCVCVLLFGVVVIVVLVAPVVDIRLLTFFILWFSAVGAGGGACSFLCFCALLLVAFFREVVAGLCSSGRASVPV